LRVGVGLRLLFKRNGVGKRSPQKKEKGSTTQPTEPVVSFFFKRVLRKRSGKKAI